MTIVYFERMVSCSANCVELRHYLSSAILCRCIHRERHQVMGCSIGIVFGDGRNTMAH